MKKIVLSSLVLAAALSAHAQNIMPENDLAPQAVPRPVKKKFDQKVLSRICIDVNHFGGRLNQQITGTSLTKNYPDAINTKVSGLKTGHSMTRGFDAEIGYYLDMEGRYGVAAGFMFAQQSTELTLDNFHIEYRSTDNFNNTFRQSLTSTGQIKEKVSMNSFSIPLLFKYKLKINDKIGFNADGGFLFTLAERVNYNTNAAFDYEAIYKYTGVQGNVVPVYDNSSVPAAGDLLLTRNQYVSTHPTSSVQEYFSSYYSQGYNVGLAVKPGNSNGTVSDYHGTVGILIRPSVNVILSHAISINAGVFYLYQGFSHGVQADYRLTNKVGEYNPLVGSISKANNNSFGMSIGASYSFRRVIRVPVTQVADTSSVVPEDDDSEAPAMPATGGGSSGSNNLHSNIAEGILNNNTDLYLNGKSH